METQHAGGRDTLVAALDEVTRLCQETRIREVGLSQAVELLTAMKRTARFLDGAKLTAIGHIEQLQAQRQAQFDQLPEGNGRQLPLPGDQRNLGDALTSSGQQSKAQTGRELSQARAAAAYPRFGKAMQAGLSASYLDVLTAMIGKDLAAHARADEARLLEAALNEPVEQFRRTVRAWLVTHRPVQAEREAAQEARQQKLSVYPDGGGYRLSGWLTAANGTTLSHALAAIVGVPAKEDRRHPHQRNAEALTLLAGTRANAGPGAGAAGPQHEILVHVPLGTLVQTEKAIAAECTGGADCPTTGAGLGRQGACLDARDALEQDLGGALAMIRAGMDISMLEGFAPATLPDGSSLAPSQLAQMLCDSAITRAVFTAHGEPLDISRKQRLFSPKQAKAVIARDRYCRFPGCMRGPEYGQIHHAHQHEKGGATTVDNAVLLCFAHHGVIHRDQITITHHQGGFSFSRRDGTRIGVTRHRAELRL